MIEGLRLKSSIGFPLECWAEKEQKEHKEQKTQLSWHRRKLILDDKTKTLQYYTDESKEDKKGELLMIPEIIDVIELDDNREDKPNVVINLKREGTCVATFAFSTSAEKQLWYTALLDVIMGPKVFVPEIFADGFRVSIPLEVQYDDILHYPASMTKVDDGNNISPSVTAKKPRVTYTSYFPNEYHTFLMVDIDTPSRASRDGVEFAHWLVTDIPGDDIAKGREILPYVGPSPSKLSGMHRILFFLFRQKGLLSEQQLYDTKTYFITRTKLRVSQWAFNVGCELPVSVTGFQSRWDGFCGDCLSYLPQNDVVNEVCFEQEKQLGRFSTYHIVQICSCCSDYKIDEESDILAARELSNIEESNPHSQFLAFVTENCCSSNTLHADENSMCRRLLDGHEVALCGSFDYRDAFSTAWENLITSAANLYYRFMDYRTIACCFNEEENDGPVEILSAKHRCDNYSEAQRQVVSLSIIYIYIYIYIYIGQRNKE
jgi:phosphatidylethanolamine-binding protein